MLQENLSSATDDCSEQFSQYEASTHCPLPSYIYITKQIQECFMKCEKPPSSCCEDKCIAEGLNLYQDGKFSGENLIKTFQNFFSKFNVSYEEEWMPVIKKSFEDCQSIFRKNELNEEKYFSYIKFFFFNFSWRWQSNGKIVWFSHELLHHR